MTTTPGLNPARALTAAALKLRQTATTARTIAPDPWDLDTSNPSVGEGVIWAANRLIVADHSCEKPGEGADLPHLALMGPATGLAIADWLEATASEMTAVDGTEYRAVGDGHDFASRNATLALARRILDGAS